MQPEYHNVLLVTKDNKISSKITDILVRPIFNVSLTSNFNEARRIIMEQQYSIIIVDFNDNFDLDFSFDAADSSSVVILIVPANHFDHISFEAEKYGILTVVKPFDTFYFYNIIKIALAVHNKIKALSSQTIKLQEKMEEIRLINKAKFILIKENNMTEEEAHKYIEKNAMDNCVTKVTIAKNIINRCSNNFKT